MVASVPDAPAGASEANSASGPPVTTMTMAANAEPARKLGFRSARSFAAPPRKLPVMDHHGVPSSSSAEASNERFIAVSRTPPRGIAAKRRGDDSILAGTSH